MVDYPHNAKTMPPGVKKAARLILNHALENGAVTIPKLCQRCGKLGAVEAHHINYYMPLSVVWLCKPCHLAQHPSQDWGYKTSSSMVRPFDNYGKGAQDE